MLMVNFYGGSNDGFVLHFQNDTNTVSITDNIPPAFASATQPGCNGSSIQVSFSEKIDCTTMQASGFSIAGHTISIANSGCNNNMTYAVTLNISPPLAPGSYTLHGQTITDLCGNPLNDSINFTINNAILTVYVTGNDFYQGSTTTVTANTTGSGSLNYIWSNGGTGPTIIVSTGGIYCVTVTDLCADLANDCKNITMLADTTVEISEGNIQNKIAIYPNPNNGRFSIESTQIIKDFEIYNCLGKLIYKKDPMEKGTTPVNIEEYASGIYLLKMITNKNIFTQKIIVVK